MDDDLDIEINTEKLIYLIQDQPAIYDKTVPPLDHKEKQNIWFNICKELIEGWEQRPQLEKTQIGIKVYSRWKNLRTCFRREYNLQKEEAKAYSFCKWDYPIIQKKRKKYEFYDQLHFLLPTVKKYSSKTNFPEGPVPIERQMTSRAAPRVVFVDSSPTTPPSSEGEQRGDTVKISGINLPLIKMYRVSSGQATQPNAPSTPMHQAPQPNPTGTAAQPIAPRPPVDEDRHFLLSVLPALQRMTRSQKLKAKMKFLQAISDIEAEARESLQRFLCFTHQSNQDPPELIPGRVRPFVAQADHTYYLVHERSNKRARMMSESTGTVKAENDNLQENAQVTNLQENAQVTNLQDNADSGNFQENSASGNLQENFEVANLQNITASGNVQEMDEDAISYESIEIGNLQENAEDAKSHESIESNLVETSVHGNSQEPAEIGNWQGNIEVGNLQEHVDIGNIQDTIEISDVLETAEITSSQEYVEIGNVQETVGIGNSQENAEGSNLHDNVEIGNVQEAVEVGNSPENAELGNIQENVEIIVVQETAEVDNLQENVAKQ